MLIFCRERYAEWQTHIFHVVSWLKSDRNITKECELLWGIWEVEEWGSQYFRFTGHRLFLNLFFSMIYWFLIRRLWGTRKSGTIFFIFTLELWLKVILRRSKFEKMLYSFSFMISVYFQKIDPFWGSYLKEWYPIFHFHTRFCVCWNIVMCHDWNESILISYVMCVMVIANFEPLRGRNRNEWSILHLYTRSRELLCKILKTNGVS